MTARDGDWLFAPFQCDKCWFFNLFHSFPNEYRSEDKRNLQLIRRANLDMFWSRERSTISSNVGRVKEILVKWDQGRGHYPLADISVWKEEDKMGMGIAIMMLKKSLQKGKLADYTQFDTCRNLRSAASNLYMATADANENRATLKAKRWKRVASSR